jgi:hypothetical protein
MGLGYNGIPGHEEVDRIAKPRALNHIAGSPQSYLIANITSQAVLKCRASTEQEHRSLHLVDSKHRTQL